MHSRCATYMLCLASHSLKAFQTGYQLVTQYQEIDINPWANHTNTFPAIIYIITNVNEMITTPQDFYPIWFTNEEPLVKQPCDLYVSIAYLNAVHSLYWNVFGWNKFKYI